MTKVYYGEKKCESFYKNGKVCRNNAYWKLKGKYLCGVHSRKDKIYRIGLEKNKNKKVERQLLINNILLLVETHKKINTRGELIVRKMKMRQFVDYVEGYFPIFPNSKHQNRKDGYGCKNLSPMHLGYVEHEMFLWLNGEKIIIPKAYNLENYYQGAKIFDKDSTVINGNVELTHEGVLKRIEMYNDKIGKRHKYRRKDKPFFSVYYDKEGNEKRYDYLESRYFYCFWYEKLAKKTKEYKVLVNKLNEGYNLCIYGYDGRELDNKKGLNHKEFMYNEYFNLLTPFGHELVLYCLLTIDNPDDYPWNIYYIENKDIYSNIF